MVTNSPQEIKNSGCGKLGGGCGFWVFGRDGHNIFLACFREKSVARKTCVSMVGLSLSLD